MNKLQKFKASAALFAVTALTMGGSLSASATSMVQEKADNTIAQNSGPVLNVCREMNLSSRDYFGLREAPGVDSDVLVQMYPGEEVVLVRQNLLGRDGNVWHEIVDSAGNRGYILAEMNGMSTLRTCPYSARW